MSEPITVSCPSCRHSYRVSTAAVGHYARCGKCGSSFLIAPPAPPDEDTVLSWITGKEPAPAPAAGATGRPAPAPSSAAASTAAQSAEHSTVPTPNSSTGVPEPEPEPAEQGECGEPSTDADQHREDKAAPLVQLVNIDADGAHFEFPLALLADEKLRDSFPRTCVGCGARHGLFIHLVYWPDRMQDTEVVHWKRDQNTPAGEWSHFANKPAGTWLQSLPKPRGCLPPLDAPFPFLLCHNCRATHEVRGRLSVRDDGETCELFIRSLATAADFYRRNGGRNTAEYEWLIKQRDVRHDPRNELSPEVRTRLAQWFMALPGEQFVHFFPDAEFAETGKAGAALTVRRLVFRKFAAYRDYSLQQPCRLEFQHQGSRCLVRILEEGHRPAHLILDEKEAAHLVQALRSLGCRWTVVE